MTNRMYTGSQIVFKGHGFLTDLFASVADASATVELFDGVNDNGIALFKGVVGDDYQIHFTPRTFPHFDTGLYLKCSSASMTVNIGIRDE